MSRRLAAWRWTKCVVTFVERPQQLLEQGDSDALLLADETMDVEPKQLPEAA